MKKITWIWVLGFWVICICVGITMGLLSAGCGGLPDATTKTPAVTCDDIQHHIIDVGCPDGNAICQTEVRKVIETRILPRVPDGIDVDTYCNAALALGALPTDCIMAAMTTNEIVKCLNDAYPPTE